MSNEKEREMLDLEPCNFIKNCGISINELTPIQYVWVWTHIMDHFLINLANILDQMQEDKKEKENVLYKLLGDYLMSLKEKLEEL